jgi:hypothetical protein
MRHGATPLIHASARVNRARTSGPSDTSNPAFECEPEQRNRIDRITLPKTITIPLQDQYSLDHVASLRDQQPEVVLIRNLVEASVRNFLRNF